ncbi:unnamed protein product [marine sediment metagenome]|uniref:Uncharacterized protein n=1 Tax=marine sediment metagenome TaxID=412755 RepID=X1A1C5_9ZZZZ
MMKEIEDNIAILKDMAEQARDSQTLPEYLRIQNAMLKGMLETLELFYKLMTQ